MVEFRGGDIDVGKRKQGIVIAFNAEYAETQRRPEK
jgi:hypothetical protein